MSLQKLMINQAEYNKWVNQQYVNWLSAKPDALLHQELPSSYSSIIKTLNHIWGTQEYWWSIIAETTDFENRYHAEVFVTKEICEGLIRNCGRLVEYLQSVPEKELLKHVKVETPWFKSDFPKYEYLQHLISHGLYHRGQIVTIGRNIGITDAPMTDYNYYNVYKAESVPTH